MLIWGTRATRRQISTGEFQCPSCRSVQAYRQMRAQPHGHVYWIPLFPVGQAIEYVECLTCSGTFDGQVLTAADDHRARVAAAYQLGVLRVMVSIMLADGDCADEERNMIVRIYETVAGRALTQGELDAAIAAVGDRSGDLQHYLHDLEPHLNDVGKERIVQAAFAVAAADGHFDEYEAREVQGVARALGMSAAHVKGVMAEMAA